MDELTSFEEWFEKEGCLLLNDDSEDKLRALKLAYLAGKGNGIDRCREIVELNKNIKSL